MNTHSKGLNKALRLPVLVNCWWDNGRVEEEKSIPLIWHYEPKTDKFYEKGHFCSANCVKAHILKLNMGPLRKQQILTWNWMYWKNHKPLCLNATPFVKPAPDREELEFFVKGGTKLEEYRAKYCINKM
jgi:hypothetical protein